MAQTTIQPGDVFTRWTVIARAPNDSWQSARFLCRCACGAERIVAAGHLRSGHCRSCGCHRNDLLRANRRTHGKTNTSEYNVWMGIKQRCLNPRSKAFQWYGGRGITICDEWRGSFATFLRDVGPRPSPAHSLDRYPDVNGPYVLGNVRWATWAEQGSNKRNTIRVTFHGETLTLAEWGKRLHITPKVIDSRLRGGWSVDQAFHTPLATKPSRLA